MSIQVKRLSQHLHEICLYWSKIRCISPSWLNQTKDFQIKFKIIKLTALPPWTITCLSWTGTGSLALMLSVNQLTFSSRVCWGSSVSFSTFMAWAAVSYSVIMWVTLSLQYWKLITNPMNVLALSLSVSISLQFLHQFLNFVGGFFMLLLEESLQPKDIQFFNIQCLNIQCICHL